MKKIMFLSLLLLVSMWGYGQFTFPAIPGPINVPNGTPPNVPVNDAANTAAVPGVLYSEFTITVNWTNGFNAWSSEADLTINTAGDSVLIDPPTTGGAINGNPTVLTFSGSFTVNYNPSVDGTLSLDFNQSHGGSDANWSNIVVTLIPAPTCPDPINLSVSSVTSSSADLEWTENGTATAWDIEWGTEGFTPTEIPDIVGTTTNPHQLLGLSPQTIYDFYVRANCGAGDESNWVGPYTFQTACSSQLSGTYTIGATGDYATLSDAVDTLNACGVSGTVTFNVLPGSGPYNEQITIGEIAGASVVNTVTFNGNGETLTSITTSSDRHLIMLDGADYVTIDNFNLVTQSDINNFVITLTNNADHNTISNNVIDMSTTLSSTSTTNAGIVVSGSTTSATATTGSSGTNNVIDSNTIIGGYYGININGQSATPSLNNEITNNIVKDFYFYGISLRYNNSSGVFDNEISRPDRSSLSTFNGIYLATGGENNIVSGNYIHTPFGGLSGTSTSANYGIYHTSIDATVGSENTVINNIVHLTGNNGTIYALYNTGSDGVHYYHNTVVLDDANSTSGLTRGFYQTTAASNIELKNNIFSITREGSSNKHVLYFNTATTTFVSDNNVLYLNSSGGTNGIGYYSSSTHTTLTDWQTATSGDMASVDADPLFVNPLAGDFTPSSSAVNNIGVPVGVPTDINGVPRDATTPDAGAIEFTPPACPQPSDLTATNMTATTADLGWTENGTATVWDIEIGQEGFIPTEVPTYAGVTTNPYTVGSLTALTDYDYYVRANCGGGDESVWIGPFTFKTGCTGPLAGSYTVGDTGDFETLSDAAYALNTCGISASVSISVLPGSGPYEEQITIGEVVGLDATNTLVINGNGETLTSTTTSSDRHLIMLDGADYVTIVNFNLVTQSDLNNFTILLTNNADNNVITNNVIDMSSTLSSTSTTNAGILVSGSTTSATATTGSSGTDNVIAGNTIIGGYYGINVNGQSATPSMNNIISNNTVLDFYSFGISLRNNNNSVVANNEVSRPNRSSLTTFNGIYFASGGENNIVSGNNIHTPFGGLSGTSTSANYGIFHTGVDATVGSENTVINNIVHLTGNNGTIYALYNSGSDGVHYYHNTVVLDDANSTSGLTRGFYQTTAASNIELKNNIFSITREGSSNKHVLYFNTATTTFVSDNNVLYLNSSGGTNGIGYYSGSTHTTLTDWQTATSGDMASVDANPLFVNPAGSDFTPSNPAVDNIGTPAGVTTDINGDPRDAVTPDAGAIEFTPPSCIQPSALTATNITENSADLGWTENGTATTWDIEWGEAGFTPTGTPTIAGVTNPYPLTGLNGATKYEFYVRADCGGGDTSTWTGPYLFSTLCSAVVVAPWTEDFENEGNIPPCWSQGVANNEDWQFSTSAQYAGDAGDFNGTTTESGGYFAWVDDSTPHSMGTTLESNFIDVSGLTVPMLSFYYSSYSNNFANVEFTVSVWDGAAWNTVHFSNTDTNNNGEWEKVIVDLSTLTITGNIQLRFIVDEVGTGGSDFYDDLAIDDVSIYEGLTCDAPTALVLDGNTDTTADISWTASPDETNGYNWVLMEDGDDPLTDTPVDSGNVGTGITTVALTGLDDDTTYDFYVQTDCGSGDLSTWVGPLNFTTDEFVCDAPSNLTLDANTDTTADISWTASSNETNGYNWVLMDENDDPDTDTPVDDGSVTSGITSVALTGLDDDTTYDFYVQADCGTALTAWIGPLNFTTDVASAGPVNDDCADAVALVVGVDFADESVVGTNEDATNDPNDPLPTCDAFNFATNGKDVWYTVVVPASGYITVETRTNSDSNMSDTGLQIYSGTCGNLTSIECNADDGDGNFSKIELSGQTAGETLLVRVWGYNTNEGEFLISAYDDYDPNAFPAPYCAAELTDCTYESITNVTFAGINNTTACNSGINDYTSQIATVAQGATEQISVTIANTFGDTEYIYVFIDWNQNNVLDDAGEVYTVATATTSAGPHTHNIDVPAGAVLGDTRMRVILVYDDPTPDPCIFDTFGEIEDYTVHVEAAPLACESPSNLVLSNITETALDISWDEPADISEVEGYGWRVMNAGDDPETDVPVVEDFVLVGTTTGMITGLTPDTPYDLYLVSICDFVTEFFSDPLIENFSTLPLPSDCDMPTALVVDDVTTTTATISWDASASETNGYEWVVMAEGEDPLTDTPVNSGDVGTGIVTVTVNDLEEDTTYDFYLRTLCDDSEVSDWQGPLTFTTKELGLNDNHFVQISLYPNPMNGVLHMEAQAEIESFVIYSLTGQKLIESKVKGLNTQVDVSELSSGPYMIRVVTATGKIGIFKLIKK